MVYYELPKRNWRQQIPEDKANIMDLPEEMIVAIAAALPTNDVLSMRATHRELTRIANDAIRDQMKILHIHPSRTSLRAVPQICEHPFSKKVEEVILLGDVPLEEIHKAMESVDPNRTLREKFATWPRLFPEDNMKIAKNPFDERGHHQRPTTSVLIDSLLKLPKLKSLSYQINPCKPALNATCLETIKSFSKTYIKARNTDADRLTDIQMLLHLLASPHLQKLSSFTVRSPLPFAPLSFNTDYNLRNLTHLALSLDVFPDRRFDFVWEQSRWQKMCSEFLASAPNLESLELVLIGTAKMKKAIQCQSATLSRLALEQRTFPALKRATIRLLEDVWHSSGPRRPSCQVFENLQGLIGFLERHTSTLEEVHLDNVLFGVCSTLPAAIYSQERPTAIETLQRIMKILHKSNVEAEYVLNKFRHHQYCKMKEESRFQNCRCDCGLYTPVEVDMGTTMRDLEGFAERVMMGGVEGMRVEESEEEWRFSCEAVKKIEEIREVYCFF